MLDFSSGMLDFSSILSQFSPLQLPPPPHSLACSTAYDSVGWEICWLYGWSHNFWIFFHIIKIKLWLISTRVTVWQKKIVFRWKITVFDVVEFSLITSGCLEKKSTTRRYVVEPSSWNKSVYTFSQGCFGRGVKIRGSWGWELFSLIRSTFE